MVVLGVPNADQTGWDFTVTAAESATIPAGPVSWQERIKRMDEILVVGAGTSTVCPNLETATDWNPLSPAQRFLNALLALGPTVLANGYVSQSVDGMLVQYRSLDEYNRALKAARQAVIDEKNAGGACFPGNPGKAKGNLILARFSTP